MYVRRAFPFQPFFRTLGPIQISKADTNILEMIQVAMLVRAQTHAHIHTYTHDCLRHSSRNKHHSIYIWKKKMKFNITFIERDDDHFVSFVGKRKTQLISGNKLAYLQHARDGTITSWCFVMRKILAAMELLHLHNILRPRQSVDFSQSKFSDAFSSTKTSVYRFQFRGGSLVHVQLKMHRCR